MNNSIKTATIQGGLIVEILFCIFLLYKFPAVEVRFPIFMYWGCIVVLTVSLSLSNRTKEYLGVFFKMSFLTILTYILLVLRSPSLMGTYLVKIMGLYIYMIMGQEIIKTGNRKKIGFYLVFMLLFYLITSLTTVIGCQIYPMASRDLASNVQGDSGMSTIYRSMNIGGFDFIYSVVLIVPLIICAIKNKMLSAIIGLPLIFLITFTVYLTQYTTAFIIVLAGLGSFFFVTKRRGKSSAVNVLMAIVFAFFVSFIVVRVIDSVAMSDQTDLLSSRLMGISSFLRGQNSSIEQIDGMDSRMERWQMSLDVIKSHPIIGHWSYEGVGGHSFILDSIAIFGLIGLILLMWMYKGIYKNYILPYKHSQGYKYFLFVYILSILIAFLNPFSNIEFFVFILPLAGHYLSKQID